MEFHHVFGVLMIILCLLMAIIISDGGKLYQKILFRYFKNYLKILEPRVSNKPTVWRISRDLKFLNLNVIIWGFKVI